MEFRDLFVKQKESIRRRTREALALVRPEDFAWRPEKDALTIGEMLQHLWVSEQGVRRVALEGDFSYYETRVPRGLRATLGPPRSLAEEIAQLEKVHRETIAAVAAWPEERFDEERVNSPLGFRRKVYVILLGINEHEVHHRAQLMTYLRILGRPVRDAASRR
jgi:uncharacterized damage-inducible protein DinB